MAGGFGRVGAAVLQIPLLASCGLNAAAPAVIANIRGGRASSARPPGTTPADMPVKSAWRMMILAARRRRPCETRGVTRANRIAAGRADRNGGILISNNADPLPRMLRRVVSAPIPLDRYAPLHEAAGGCEPGSRKYGDPDKPERMGTGCRLIPPIHAAKTRAGEISGRS